MPLLIAGYWPTTYWVEDYWAVDYWPEYSTGAAPIIYSCLITGVDTISGKLVVIQGKISLI